MQKLAQDSLVHSRKQRWRVVEARSFPDCTLISLSGAEAANAGSLRHLLAPFDIVEPVATRARPLRVGAPRWRRACRGLLADVAPPGALRTARRASLDLLPHQLEPALAILRGDGTRVLLADEVGLGKTVQAALIVSELRARRAADRVLILTPAGLREQWRDELASRVSLDAMVVDAADIRRRAAVLPAGVDPWQTMPLAIASIDYVKRPEVLPAVVSQPWDVVIIDEAHGVAADSDRHAAAVRLASAAVFVLLLTATPHNGDRRAFASLCAIGSVDDSPLLFFRRSRQDVRPGVVRRVRHLMVRCRAAERRMHTLLAAFVSALRREHGDAISLAASVLHKRAFSSAHSLQRSVERRLDVLAGVAASQTEQLPLPLGDPDGDLTSADELPAWSADLGMADASRETRLLRQLASAAGAAGHDESKIAALRRLLRRAHEPAIVFTEFRDTLLHIRDVLRIPTAILHGGLRRAERVAALGSFTSGAVQVLLATDAAAEGLNLQHACRLVINLELPWNPMRLEQRVGRVDRLGQRRTVHAVHFIARHTGERLILDRLRARVVLARRDAGATDPLGSMSATSSGAEEERAVAQLVTIGASPGPPPSADDGVPSLARPDLELEAVCEAARIGAARARADAADDRQCGWLHASAPWIARTRNPTTRAHLRRGALLIYEVAVEDEGGNALDWTIVPVRIEPRDPACRWENVPLSLPSTAQLVDQASCLWRGTAARVADAFTAARRVRVAAIASRAVSTAGTPLQQGLFDKRAEAAYVAEAEHHEAHRRQLAQRVARLEDASAVVPGVPRLLLVLTA